MSFGVATLRAVVHAGDKTSGDARCVINKGKCEVLGIKDEYNWEFIGGQLLTFSKDDGQGCPCSGQGRDQGRGQGNGRNQNGDVVDDNIRGDVSRGCTYKEFLAYNPMELSRGGTLKSTHKVEKMVGHSRKVLVQAEAMQRLPSMGVGGLIMHWLGMVAATEPKTIQKAVEIASTLTDEALRNGSIKKRTLRIREKRNLAGMEM
ncbi:hypothetical protein Tco_0435979 [Tanacetum coccineum]